MKIVYFIQMNMPSGSGVFKKIAAQASEWAQMGHDVTLAISTKHKEYLSYSIDHIKLIVDTYDSNLPPPFDGRLPSISRLIKKINSIDPDVIYTRQDIFYPRMILMYTRHRVITEVNTDDLNEIKHPSKFFMIYYSLTRKIPLVLSKGVIYVSEEISRKPYYSKYAKRFKIIGNGINLDNYEPLPPIGKSDNIVFIGHHSQPWHGVDKIILLAKLLPEYKFHIIGTDSSEITMRYTENLHFYGYLPKEKYLPIFRESVCAIASLAMHRNGMNEASPLKSREYMALGLPIISAYIDTDFPNGSDLILKIDNREDNITENIDKIVKFIKIWQSKRVSRQSVKHIDTKVKEALRIQFFNEVVKND